MRKSRGATLIEYGLLAGLVSTVAITAVASNGDKVRDIFENVAAGTSAAMAEAPQVEVEPDAGEGVPDAGSGGSDGESGGSDGEPETPDTGPTTPPPPPSLTCPSNLEIEGQSYGVVKIGNQCWMSENLNVATPSSMCYDNDPANCDTYGRLYKMVSYPDVAPYCPGDWRIARDEDWAALEITLGMSEEEVFMEEPNKSATWRESGDVEEQLATFVSGGTNSSGFNALPGGWAYNGDSRLIGSSVIYMSAGAARWRYLRDDIEGVSRRNGIRETRYSVYARCVLNGE